MVSKVDTSRPRVLHIIANFSVGGAEMHLLYLVEGLLKSGEFNVDVAYLRERPDDARSLVPDFQRLGVQPVDLKMGPVGDLRVAVRLHSLLGRVRPALVHTHLLPAHLFGIPVSRLRGVPVVSTVHGIERHFFRPIRRRAYRALLNRARVVIGISEAVKQAVVDQVGVPDEKVAVIPYGFPIGDTGAASSRGALSQDGQAPLIVTVGRVDEAKGHRYLLEAMMGVRSVYASARAVIVGHDGGLMSALRAQSTRMGLDDCVTFTGFRDDVPQILAGADVFVFPSLTEGFGLVLLEAMAAGLPVVASRVGGIKDVVFDGETGLLVPPADSRALSDAIIHVLRDPAKARRMGEQGRARLLKTFTVERMVESTQVVYRRMLGGVGAS